MALRLEGDEALVASWRAQIAEAEARRTEELRAFS
jgi:hypothetical protein